MSRNAAVDCNMRIALICVFCLDNQRALVMTLLRRPSFNGALASNPGVTVGAALACSSPTLDTGARS